MKYTCEQANHFIHDHKSAVLSKYRPHFHLAPPIGWVNDPNGFVFFQEKYHLFYQFFPYEPQWGPMHWGHAVSNDLIRFEDRGVALAPDHPLESGCFSGGAIVDPKNPNRLFLTYTQHLETPSGIEEGQNLVTSNDGRIFSKRATPILTAADLPKNASIKDFRDPRPIFIDPYYYVFVGSQHTNGQGQVLVFRGQDLETLSYHFTIGPDARFGKIAECPDYFVLDGQGVLLLSATQLPSDGKRFKNVNSSLVVLLDLKIEKGTYHIHSFEEIDLGHDFYAPQTLLDPQGRRIMTAWMAMWGKSNYTAIQGHGWSGSFIFPRELSLKNGRFNQWPISEIGNYYGETFDFKKGLKIEKQSDLTLFFAQLADWELRFENPNNASDYFSLGREKGRVYFESVHSKEYPQDRRISLNEYPERIFLRLLIDSSSVEIFIDGGRETITSLIYFDCETYRLHLAKGDAAQVSGKIHRLKPEAKK